MSSSDKLLLCADSVLETLRPNNVLNEARLARLNALECVKVAEQTRDQIGWLWLRNSRSRIFVTVVNLCASDDLEKMESQIQ